MSDRTGEFHDGDTFKFAKITLRGSDLNDPLGTKGKTGQDSMGIYKFKMGALRLVAPMDPFKEHKIETQTTEPPEPEPTPSQWKCPYEWCPYDADKDKYGERWRVEKKREEEERKREEQTRREARQGKK